MNKRIQVNLRMTKQEKEFFKKRAEKAGYTLSKYAKICMSNKPLVNKEALLKLIREINRIGNNINQATKIMNTYHTYDDIDYNYIYKEFMELKERIDDFIDKENQKRYGNS